MKFKEQIVLRYNIMLQDKIDLFKDMIEKMSLDSRNDAKSSAGDKHETALSMLHIEQEKIAAKIQQLLEQQENFTKIDFTKNHSIAGAGSLVHANESYFLISIALPKIVVQGANVYGISPNSPLAAEILGKGIGFECKINNSHYQIYDIF